MLRWLVRENKKNLRNNLNFKKMFMDLLKKRPVDVVIGEVDVCCKLEFTDFSPFCLMALFEVYMSEMIHVLF